MTITALISELQDNLRAYGDMDVKFLWERRDGETEANEIILDRVKHPIGTVNILSIRKFGRGALQREENV